MKRNARNAMNELQKLGVPVFERADIKYFGISAEDSESYKWLDYYGEFRGGFTWVNEQLEEVLHKHGLFAEWENAACMIVYDA
jgi:hypothetical protein